jgi:hypothetical protein
MAFRSTILNLSFAVPSGTFDRLIGGDLESKHFFVGPHSKLNDIADAVAVMPNNRTTE